MSENLRKFLTNKYKRGKNYTDFIFVYRHYYKLFSSEWEDKNLNTKLTAVGRRILGTHLTAMAYKKALDQVNIAESFLKRGYLWPTTDGSHIFLRELQGYRYDPAAPLLWLVRPHPDPHDQPEKKKQKLHQPKLSSLWSK